MGEYHIQGGVPLSGAIKISGAKNSILPILAAVILNSGKSIIYDVPEISDTFISIEILKAIGCAVSFSEGILEVDSKEAYNTDIPLELVSGMRSSINFMGSMLSRFSRVKLSYPGGCDLGSRPIDLHIKSLRKLGATINEEGGFLICEAKDLRGTRISLDIPSVGATENIMMAAVFAKGETRILNAAREPEVVDLQQFLVKMGAKVKGAGTDTVIIEGVNSLHEANHRIIPDRIVAGTFLTAAAMTGGEILCKNVINEHLYPITSKLVEAGCSIMEGEHSLYLRAPKHLRAIRRITTSYHPGFPTDMQPQLTALLSVSKGISVINETVFDARNRHIPELHKMGADIYLSTDMTTFFIKGVSKLRGARVASSDLRGGAALILAGLAAEGETIVTEAKHIRRGYEKIEDRLIELGARIKYVE